MNQKCLQLCYDPVTAVQWVVMISYLSSNPTIFYTYQSSIVNVNYAQIVNNYLFVLENDPSNWQETPSKVHILNITLGSGTGVPINYIGYADGSTFGVDGIYAGGFDVFQITNGYRILISDATVGIRTIDYDSSIGSWVNITSNILSSDPAFSGQYLPANIIWSGVAKVSSLADNYLEFIVISENSNSFYISWQPQLGNQNPKLKVLQGFLNFRGFTNLNIFDFNTDATFLSIVARNPFDDTLWALVYNTTALYNADSVQYSTILGYVPFAVNNPNIYGLQVWDDGNGLVKMWVPNVTPTNGSIQEYDLRVNLTFLVINPVIQSQYINLSASNYYSSQNIQFALNSSGSLPTEDSGNVVWIILLVIILLVVVTLMVIAVKKCKQIEPMGAEEKPLIVNQA